MELVFGIPVKKRDGNSNVEKYPNQAVLTFLPESTNGDRTYRRFMLNTLATLNLFNTPEEKLYGSISVQKGEVFLCNVSSLGDNLDKSKKFVFNKGTKTFSDTPVWNFFVTHFNLNPTVENEFLLSEVNNINGILVSKVTLITNSEVKEEVTEQNNNVETTQQDETADLSEVPYEELENQEQAELDALQGQAEYAEQMNAEAENDINAF